MTDKLEHYVEILAVHVRDRVLRPASRDESVRVHSDGFVTLTATGELFAAVDLWTGPEAGEEEIETLAYILKETPQTEVDEDGVDRFFDVAYGRLRPFLRTPDGPEAPVFVYASGLVTLAPEDVPFAQVKNWDDEDIWRLTQLSEELGVPLQARPVADDPLPLGGEDEEGEDFW